MHAIALRCRRISRSGAQLDAALPVQTDQGGTTLHGTILWRLGAVCRGMADSVVVRVFVDGMDTALAEMTGSGFFCPHPADGFFHGQQFRIRNGEERLSCFSVSAAKRPRCFRGKCAVFYPPNTLDACASSLFVTLYNKVSCFMEDG